MVVFKVLVVVTAYPRLYMTGLRFNTHHAHLIKPFVINDAVARREHGVFIALPSEHRHRNGRGKSFLNAVLTCTTAFHAPVTLGVFHCTVHDALYISGGILIEIEGAVFAVFFDDVEDALKIT